MWQSYYHMWRLMEIKTCFQLHFLLWKLSVQTRGYFFLILGDDLRYISEWQDNHVTIMSNMQNFGDLLVSFIILYYNLLSKLTCVN